MNCSISGCHRVALRQVGRKGFCGVHKAEAFAAEAEKQGHHGAVRARTGHAAEWEVDQRMKELEESWESQ